MMEATEGRGGSRSEVIELDEQGRRGRRRNLNRILKDVARAR